jgi:PAS domain S-box-containing protein
MPAMASPRRESESLNIQLLVDSIPALIHTGRPDGYLDYFNKPWLEYLGATLEQVTGWNWTAFIHPEDVEGIVAKWRASLATGEVFEYETRVRSANGDFRWMFHRKVPLRDELGNIIKWYGSSLDIEERKTGEEQLRRNAKELQRSEFYLAEGQRLARMGSWAFDPDGFYYWSPELFRMHGLDPAGKPPKLQEYLDCLHPQDRDSMADLMKRVLTEASPFDATKRIVRPNGEVRYIRYVGVPVVENQSLKKYVGSAIDVTEHELLTQELRQREAYLTEAQRLSQTGSFGCNLSTGEMFWSEETFRIYGYDRSTQPAVERVLDRVHPEDRVLVQERMEQANRDEKDCGVECRLLLPDGSVKHVCIVAHPSKNESGTTEFIGAITDITARKGAEEARRSSEADLLEAQRLSHTGSWRHDVLTGIVTISPEVHRIFDIGPGEDTPTAGLFFGRIHPEDRPIEAQNYERANLTKTDFESDYRIVLTDGSIKHVHNIGHPVLNESGDIKEFVGTVIDITERKLAEETVRRSEAYLAEAQRLSHTGSFGWRPDTGEIVWSDETYRIFGFDPAEKPTISMVLQRTHPQDRASVQQVIERASKTGTDFEHEYRLLLPCGAIKHVRALAQAFRDASGNVEFVGAVTDVSEQRHAEAVIRQHEAEFRRVIDTIPALVWSAMPDGSNAYVSKRFAEYMGSSPEQTTGSGWQALVHPDDLERHVGKWMEAVATGKPHESEVRCRRSDGQYRWQLDRGVPLRDEKGNIVKWYGVTTDIEDRKTAEGKIREQEAEFRQIVDLVPQLVAVYGPNRERIYANRTALDFLGISLDAWRHETFGHSTHPDDSERFKTSADRAFSSGSAYDVELRLRKRDGTYRWFLARYNPVRDDKGHITRWYVTAADIEDRKQAEDRLLRENVALREEIDKTSMFEEIVGASPALRTVLSRISKVAPSDSTVLITGETGTGKELVARAIHRRSHRTSRAFVSVNCAAIPRDLIASELFGHEKGAFTGATQQRLGRFELANGGTIFLDEVGDLPIETQIALLRVLQEHEFERVGGTRPIRANVRVIAATNRDLQAAISAGSFRSDLFYRLNVFPIEIPALRERKEDIRLLVEYFIDRYARKTGKRITTVDKKTLRLLESYPWPGNIRELQNVIERSVIVCETENFSVDESWLSQQPSNGKTESQLYLSEKVAAQEKEIIEAALRESRGQVFGPSGAAAKLGIARSTLESKIRSLKIDKNRFRAISGT